MRNVQDFEGIREGDDRVKLTNIAPGRECVEGGFYTSIAQSAWRR
jgi:hypothetical protein